MATMGQHGDGTITARRDGRLQVAVTFAALAEADSGAPAEPVMSVAMSG
jgi:hypothetical protein